MALFDILDDIAEKQVLKTDTGDNRIFGVVVGQVTQNYHQDMPGRVCVTVTTRDTAANELKWGRLAMPFGGSGWGHYFVPEVGDQVLLAFEQGNIEKPYVIGCIPKSSDQILRKSADKNNQYKQIVTRHGSTICFEDSAEGEGEKDKIEIYTAKKGHRIELDNEANAITLSDKDGKNQIKLETEQGQMTIQAEKKLTIKVGDNIELILNGGNGTVKLQCEKLNIDTSGNISLSASGSAKVSAGNITAEASSMLKMNSGGAVTVAGAPIKLG